MSTILKIKNVTKTFGDEIIFKNANLIVKKGEVISIIGKSGSGKSTFLKCLNRLEEINGGEILFDNMPTVVDRANSRIGNVKINGKFMQYAKDVGFKVITCKAYRPQTKGKVESLAKLVDRLKVYNNEFKNYEELEKIVNDFMEEINNEISQGTNEKPVDRLKKETKYLLPLPNQDILKTYIASPKEYKVSKESMITYKGQKYSVPTYLIGELVSVKETNEYIHIYYTTNLITTHRKTDKFLNYQKEHLKDILKSDAFKDMLELDIERFAEEYLQDYDNL